MVRLAIDAMGGDNGHAVIIPAALEALKQHPELRVFLVGDETLLVDALADYDAQAFMMPDEGTPQRLFVSHAPEVVGMDERPAAALRHKKQSSMHIALQALAQGDVDACVSAGNTGALMAISRHLLGTCEGVDRPAILSVLPGRDGDSYMLDLGANVDCNSEQLHMFAQLGHIVACQLKNTAEPKVALLNIGEEDVKGNDQVKRAHELLRNDRVINYVGFVEGSDLLSGQVDVIVCDGFIGNVALKSIEGTSQYLLQELNTIASSKGWLKSLFSWAFSPLQEQLEQGFSPGRYNGATFVGLRGVVIKSHGSADERAFGNAINLAIKEAEQELPRIIATQLDYDQTLGL